MSFSALILAGGQSSRMGRDKALLEIDGVTLLARQIQLVRSLGATDILISARAEANYSAPSCRILRDELLDAGPLAGIARGLDEMREPLLLVLAVDMANLHAEFLKQLHAECREGVGAVPKVGDLIEPLAAFFPKAAAAVLRDMLTSAKAGSVPGVKHFSQACVAAGLAQFVTVPSTEADCLKSWNTPGDLPAL